VLFILCVGVWCTRGVCERECNGGKRLKFNPKKRGVLEPSPCDIINNSLLTLSDVLAVLRYGCLLFKSF